MFWKINRLFLLIALYPVCLFSQTGLQEPAMVLPGGFIHPGMMQNTDDLEYMKAKIHAGEEEWVHAFDLLQNETSLDFMAEPFTHVVRGSYGREGQGHRELSSSAAQAYRHALLWYLKKDKNHAEKAIDIINAWSETLWDFDDNDAKLIAGLTGQHFLNAAEILRYTGAGWKNEDIQRFSRLMLTVYYPYIQDFFDEANGNWDAAMINTMLCIGVFTDRQDIFQRAIERFFWGPNNGGITKYIYPNGQIQESTRDWPHVQLGLGEFAKAAQVAWTQGVDLYKVADNRLALGVEYTSRFMLGEEVPVYGTISQRGRGEFRDIYESVLFHYTQVKGIEMPFTQEAAKQIRPQSSLNFLVSRRAPAPKRKTHPLNSLNHGHLHTGVLEEMVDTDENAIRVKPGEPIQAALDITAGTGKKVILEKGIHTLSQTLLVPSHTTLIGRGKGTVLILRSNITGLTIGNKESELEDVTLKNFVIEGATSVNPGTDPNQGRRARARMSAPRREGIVFSAETEGQIHNIRLENLTVRNFTKHGVSIRGAIDVQIESCDFSDNGSNVVPGEGLHHNLHLSRVKDIQISNSRFSNSPWGSGIHLSFAERVWITNNESPRNKLHGIHVTESKGVLIKSNLIEGNDRHGIYLSRWMEGVYSPKVDDNIIRNNGGKGIIWENDSNEAIGYNLVTDNREDIIYGKNSKEFHERFESLIPLLKLDKQEMDEVRKNIANPLLAARKLLDYYRTRKEVHHPVVRGKNQFQRHVATPKDLQTANNALVNVMVGQPAYPPFYIGKDINWASRPVSDNEWVWQLNRMVYWEAMGKAYWHTGNEKYAETWCRQMMDWVHKNPRDDAHQYAWRSIEAGIRGHRWTSVFQYFLDSRYFTAESLITFLSSMYEHADFLKDQYKKGSNWALMEAEGLGFIAMTFPEFKASKEWLDTSIERLNHEIHNQVYEDGHQRELAFGYHMGSIGWFMRTYEMAKMNGLADKFDENYLRLVEKMCEVPMKLAFPDGTTPQFGDAWTGQPGQYYEKLIEWAKLFDREDFLYVGTEGKAGSEPKSTAFALKESGLYSMRSGWDKDAVCLVLKCGPDGGGHSQPDNGTFELYAGGRNLMPDSGSFIYSGDPENRAWFRQTKVHQTLTLDGANAAYDPKLLLWKPGEDHDILVVENQSYPELAHRRAIIFVDKRFFVLIDEAIGKAGGLLELNFQLAPGEAHLDKEALSAQTAFEEGYNIFLQTVPIKGLQMRETEGQVSFIYTQKEPRPAFSYGMEKKPGSKGYRFTTLAVPYKGEIPQIHVQVVGKRRLGSRKMELEIEYNGETKTIDYILPKQ